MIFNRSIGLIIMLVLLFIGNVYGFITVSTKPNDFLNQFQKMNSTSLQILKAIQVLNIISIVGIWYFQKWAVLLALILVVLVIAIDVYYGIYYHIAVVVITTGLTGWAIVRSWHSFR